LPKKGISIENAMKKTIQDLDGDKKESHESSNEEETQINKNM
jgi:hypothetical protein